jgi:ATP synthase protein I
METDDLWHTAGVPMNTAGPARGAAPGPEEPRGPTDGLQVLSYLITGMVLYGGIGWLIGRWTALPVLFPIGMIAGLASAVALIIFRVSRN